MDRNIGERVSQTGVYLVRVLPFEACSGDDDCLGLPHQRGNDSDGIPGPRYSDHEDFLRLRETELQVLGECLRLAGIVGYVGEDVLLNLPETPHVFRCPELPGYLFDVRPLDQSLDDLGRQGRIPELVLRAKERVGASPSPLLNRNLAKPSDLPRRVVRKGPAHALADV